MGGGLDSLLRRGGAGFIGSHLVWKLLERPETAVVVYDNFCSGREWHLEGVAASPRLQVIRGDLKRREPLIQALEGVDTVIHLASNPDIAKAARQPDIDFWEGTYLTQNLLEAMRVNGVPRILYASGSGVYGDAGDAVVSEDYSPLRPISPYGASKLACEALIGSYCHLFAMQGAAFRFANVVGPRQTHGVTFDFVRRMLRDPTRLDILGDGSQSKSYIHVSDVVGALAPPRRPGLAGLRDLQRGHGRLRERPRDRGPRHTSAGGGRGRLPFRGRPARLEGGCADGPLRLGQTPPPRLGEPADLDGRPAGRGRRDDRRGQGREV